MDATIAAALISGGVGALGIVGTVVTSMVGSKNTRKTTERTVQAGTDANRATLTAAREDGLWERRAAAYEETLAGLIYRRDKRYYELLGWWNEADQELANAYDDEDSPTRFEKRGRLAAYASDAVLSASNAAGRAHSESTRLKEEVEQLRSELSKVPLDAPERVEQDELSDKFDAAHAKADAADDALIKVIRKELRSRPEAALPPPAVSAECHEFLRRRHRE